MSLILHWKRGREGFLRKEENLWVVPQRFRGREFVVVIVTKRSSLNQGIHESIGVYFRSDEAKQGNPHSRIIRSTNIAVSFLLTRKMLSY